MLTASAALALFSLLALASVVYFIAQKFSVPYTVLLTFAGVLLVPLSEISHFNFIREFTLTPELLFFIFLPTLLFESAYNMDIRKVAQEAWPIGILAIVGYLASSFLIGFGLWFALDLFGFSVPFLVTLLFGALISATDPVAVLALFKDYGAPRRLSLIFEGESLMNDATAVALFIILLELARTGMSTSSLIEGAVTFFIMLFGGIILGLLFGFGFSKLVSVFRNKEMVAITLMLVLAHITFLIAEVFNHAMHEAHLDFLKLSPIIATTVASLVMGNYGRFKVSPHAEEFVEKFWSQFAFMMNSVIFILVGLLFATIPSSSLDYWVATVIAAVVVAISRAISIYGTVVPYNWLSRPEKQIPASWQHLLSWGSLRGALAVMLALLIPADFAVPGWNLGISVRDFILLLTIASIFVTLFIKAPLVAPLMRKLEVGKLTPLERTARQGARAITHGVTLVKLKQFIEKGYVPHTSSARLIKEQQDRFQSSSAYLSDTKDHETRAEQALRLYVLGLEKEVLKELLAFEELTERVFRRIYGKLSIQIELTEEGKTGDINPSSYRDRHDLFENLIHGLRSIFPSKITEDEKVIDSYLYYRAQQILAQKVVKELNHLDPNLGQEVFSKNILNSVAKDYEAFRDRAKAEREKIAKAQPEVIETLDDTLARRSILRTEQKILSTLRKRELVSPKLFIALTEEYTDEANETRAEKVRRTIRG